MVSIHSVTVRSSVDLSLNREDSTALSSTWNDGMFIIRCGYVCLCVIRRCVDNKVCVCVCVRIPLHCPPPGMTVC